MENKEQLVDLIFEDIVKNKGEKVKYPLVLTGKKDVPVEIEGPTRDHPFGMVNERHDLRNSHEEADNIIIHQVYIIIYTRIYHVYLEFLTSTICIENSYI